ncbi:acyl-CoA dehydrogenase family protein [Gordonia insulae]|uniref:Acryloyl-CoA reductase (NADH) n=1 Tax=Gordonia insulae TaxID=2420509 RepID=A0A3G8JK63_9ACTN|nr:acyl-CoA dehydrogenase family protein [Gordonia insulae]AZG45477.1 Acryloyl-CoA reductase (NADH) [Gordonia insulae]
MTVTTLQELAELRASVRKFLETRLPESRVRELIETTTAFDAEIWMEMSSGLGLQGLAIPERFGGEGYGLREVAVVFEEMGRTLAPTPYFAAFVAAQTLLDSGDDAACARYLPALTDGSKLATVAAAERDGSWDAAVIRTRAELKADQTWELTGKKFWVPNAETADVIFVFARTTAGPTLFAVERSDKSVQVEAMRVLDGTRPLATVDLDATPAVLIGRQGGGGRLLSRVLDVAGLALASEQVGLAQRCLEMSTMYAKTRVQFGRPVGTFQAVKHICAEMLAQLEMARAATTVAVRASEQNTAESAVTAAAAHITASAAAMFVAKETIQVHGGIGFTWDHPAHLYFRRAKASEMLLGGPALSHERLLERLGI